jgi:hypothetical protein
MNPLTPLTWSAATLTRKSRALAGVLFCPLLASAQVTTEGTLAVGGGATLLNGDRPAFQKFFRQKKDGFAGLEEFAVSRTTDTSLFRFEARFIPGNEDYRLAARWEKFDAYYVTASYQRFRTFYDGSGGRFLPQNLAISYFDEALAIDRSFFTFELGTLQPNGIQWRLRFDHNTREGTKNSLRWGDSNLAGQPFVPRAFIPSYLLVDEARDIVTLEASERTDQSFWKVAGRYERTRVNHDHVARRRALEPQDRYVTMHDGADTDLFSGHGFYERTFRENLRMSAGGLIANIDTQLTGSKIYGATPLAEYSPTFIRRQPNDVGYYGLSGNTQLKQYVGNLNIFYQPSKFIAILPSVKYEHLRQESGETHTDTDFGAGAAAAIQRNIEASSRHAWNEVTEDLEVRYTRWSDWQLATRGQWNQGQGNLVEQSVLAPARTAVIDHDTDYQRLGQRYTASATWYARPGLTLGGQYNYRLKIADYTTLRDATSNAPASRDRYPSFIVDNDIESRDTSVRLSWRPKSMVSFMTRYAYQRATITTTFDNLPAIENGRLTRHIITQSASWNPTARLAFTGTVNVTYDQLWVPPHRLTFNSDNNYTSAALNAGYALGKLTDLQIDLSHYRADNYTDNPAVTLPLNAGQTLQSGALTWVRRQSARLVYIAKYTYATNREGTFGGQNDFQAHLVYGKVQYRF